MNNVKKVFCILALSAVLTSLDAKSVEFMYEDAYLKQASIITDTIG